jgi:hypothetical protein
VAAIGITYCIVHPLIIVVDANMDVVATTDDCMDSGPLGSSSTFRRTHTPEVQYSYTSLSRAGGSIVFYYSYCRLLTGCGGHFVG